MAKEIRIFLNDDQHRKFDEIALASEGNKTVVKGKLIDEALNRFHSRLFGADEPIKTMGTDANE